jgi:hypothetical protein
MKPQHIVATCLRCLAIVWLLYSLSRINGILAYARSDTYVSVNTTAVWLLVVLQIAACAALWFFPMTIASKLIPGGVPQEASAEPPQLAEWQTLGLICVGLWGCAHAIPDIVFRVTLAALSFGDDDRYGFLSPQQKAGLASSIVELAISLWLVLGAQGLAAFLHKVRTAGVAK